MFWAWYFSKSANLGVLTYSSTYSPLVEPTLNHGLRLAPFSREKMILCLGGGVVAGGFSPKSLPHFGFGHFAGNGKDVGVPHLLQ